MFATCSTTLFLVPRHPDFGKNNGKIGLFGGFRVFKNRPILPLVSRKIENNGKIGLFWFSILQLFSKIVVFCNCEKRPILQLFSENSCKIRDFFFAKAP